MSYRPEDDFEVESWRKDRRPGVGWGFCLGLLLHLFLIPLIGAMTQGGGVVFAGIVQLIYIVPALLVARSKGTRPEFQKGIILSAVVLFILSALCFGAVMLMFRGFSY